MRADSVQLTVTAGLNETALVEARFGDRGDVHMVVVIFVGFDGPTRARLENMRRDEGVESWVQPQVIVSVPVVLAPKATVGHGESWRVADSCAPPEVEYVVVNVLDGHGVLYACVAVDYHGQIVHEGRTAFGHDHHFLFSSGGDNLLALVPPRLVVAFDADRPDRFHATQVKLGVFERFDFRFKAASGPVENGSGGEYAGTGNEPCLS